ncbi:hypothetical protein PV327_001560 [Microctonus hyperodae]|uniref:Uncharacterized protein n=1 Tax=Microctonus hyperodae TaxID=165561 RepID=A0AA39G8U0_MICHY|nr:hypothetical protein PV327_001560 [Microctonus hyperodae]
MATVLQPSQQQVTVGSLGGGMSTANGNTAVTGGAQGQPLVMPGFPLRAASGPHYSPYSPSRFHIDKRCQHRCSGVDLGKSEQSGILIESLRWYKISICPVLTIDIEIMKILIAMKI